MTLGPADTLGCHGARFRSDPVSFLNGTAALRLFLAFGPWATASLLSAKAVNDNQTGLPNGSRVVSVFLNALQNHKDDEVCLMEARRSDG